MPLEVHLLEAGSLGVHGFTPNEAVHKDVGWSSFGVMEAVAKLSYERWLARWPLGLGGLRVRPPLVNTNEMGRPDLLAVGVVLGGGNPADGIPLARHKEKGVGVG